MTDAANARIDAKRAFVAREFLSLELLLNNGHAER